MAWATSVPILVFLRFAVLDLDPMYATDRQTDVRRQTKASLIIINACVLIAITEGPMIMSYLCVSFLNGTGSHVGNGCGVIVELFDVFVCRVLSVPAPRQLLLGIVSYLRYVAR